MLTDAKTLRKLQAIERRYESLRFHPLAEVPVEAAVTRQHYRTEPSGHPDLRWKPLAKGERWGGDGLTTWMRGDVSLPRECAGRSVFVRGNATAEAGHLSGIQILVFRDGQPVGVFDEYHREVLITPRGKAGRRVHLAFEAYSGHSFPGCFPDDAPVTVPDNGLTFGGVEILLEREDVSAFVFDLRVLLQLTDLLEENSLRRARITRTLDDVFSVVIAKPNHAPEEEWRPALAEARAIMAPLLALKNGPTTPHFGLIGHSHLDTAWLWTIGETTRKAARTFSTALNLMDRYPEFTFVQSVPFHTAMMETEYPDIFERMKARVAEGRWEPNGAMWVEPDCNIPSGESFVRQLLIGQRANRAWFGYTSDTLWLPDVFGYSAALPQLLQSAGVRYFCTTKIGWNDSTRFPYDTFHWQGLDGSTVLAHYNSTHCWPEPKKLNELWKNVQHKDVQDRHLCSYGFGDGGGGAMPEMIEVARRITDLEGCPRSRHTTVSAFLSRMEKELTDLPTWVGELYLELHRGTLTSIAPIKRANRKVEFLFREVEYLSSHAFLAGAAYPHAELERAWREFLVNQFHDILPGSSIAAVNDEAMASYRRIGEALGTLRRDALAALGAGDVKRPNAVTVLNTHGWERTDPLLLDVPAGTAILDDGVRSQWIETPAGEKRLAVAGHRIPALGGVRLSLGRNRQPDAPSPFKVTGTSITTPFYKVRLDKAGQITSLVYTPLGREIVASGGVLNALLVGEDVPEIWDNWDIDFDQDSKLRVVTSLLSTEVVADGPVQLRLRLERRVARSSVMLQDLVFHADTPRIDFDTVLDWNDKYQHLKASFEFNVLSETALHEIQFGHVERPTHRNLPQDRARFEVCAHKWTDLSDNGFGVALLNDCKYGVALLDNEIRLSLVKSGRHPDPRGDEGRHRFTYSLLPHEGPFTVPSVVHPAYELNDSPTVYTSASDAVPEPLLRLDAENVILDTLKKAEDDDALVLRLFEAGKRITRARLRFSRPVTSLEEVNLLEEPIGRLKVRKGEAVVDFRAFEVKTLKVTFAPAEEVPN